MTRTTGGVRLLCAWSGCFAVALECRCAHAGGMSSPSLFARFETEMQVRPDDIDMFDHVHSSRYMEIVLAARYEQMARCYGMSWEAFIERGLGWYMVATQMHFKRALGLGDRFIVRTWVDSFRRDGVKVGFEIDRADTRKRSCDGWADYTLILLATGRATALPGDIRERYSIPVE